jgi:RNA-directed DNA polymerase
MEGKGEMTKASSSLQDLRRGIYVKAKAEPSWRFWGLYVHVCKMETLHEAYSLAKQNDGAPGIDGVTFEAIETQGADGFLQCIRDELTKRTYVPLRSRRVEIPKDGGKVRVLSIPAIRDRVVQGALKLILEPIFEADFQPGSYGYRPKRTAHQALERVARAIVEQKTHVIDLDLRAYFDTVRHDVLPPVPICPATPTPESLVSNEVGYDDQQRTQGRNGQGRNGSSEEFARSGRIAGSP